MALPRVPAEAVPPLVDQRLGDRRIREPRDVGDVEPHRPHRLLLVAELRGAVIVEALALAAILDAVAEYVRLQEPAEEPREALRRAREPEDVMVELQREEVAV